MFIFISGGVSRFKFSVSQKGIQQKAPKFSVMNQELYSKMLTTVSFKVILEVRLPSKKIGKGGWHN